MRRFVQKPKLPENELDLEKFDREAKKDEFSAAALVLKIKESRFYMSLPDWIEEYVVPAGTRACSLSPIKCMARLVAMQKETGFNVHLVHQLDLTTTFNNVVINSVGVSYKDESTKEEVSLGINISYLVADMNDSVKLIHSSTADIVATDAKKDKTGNVIVPEWPEEFCVPVSDATLVRTTTGSQVPSRSKARDEIFRYLTSTVNEIKSIRLHSYIGFNLINFTENKYLTTAMQDYYNDMNLERLEDYTTKVIGIDNSMVPCTSDLSTAYKYYFQSVAIRGGRDGKNLAHGFERFSMSRTMSTTLNMLQDFLNMSGLYDCKTVLVRDLSYLTTEQIRVLVYNKFRIIQLNTNYGNCTARSVPGIYSSCDPDIVIFEFRLISDLGVAPSFANSVISMGKFYDEALNQMVKATRCFALLYLDSRLEGVKSVSFLPSATADTMQIIIATGVKTSYGLSDLVKRATMAISCRNRFVHCRKSFSTMDIANKFVKWDQNLYYPKLRAKDDKKILNFDAIEPHEEIKVVPLEVNFRQLQNKIEQIEANVMNIDNLLVDAVDQYGEEIYRAFIGNKEGKGPLHFCKTEIVWDNKYNPILDLEEIELVGVMERVGMKDNVGRYDEIVAELLGSDSEDEKPLPPPRKIEEIQFDVKKKLALAKFKVNIGADDNG